MREINISKKIAEKEDNGESKASKRNLAPIAYVKPYPRLEITQKRFPLAYGGSKPKPSQERRRFEAQFVSEVGSTKNLRDVFNNLDTKGQITFVKEMLVSLKSLHDKGIIHQDIKAGNVLLKEDGKPAFIDFGLSKMKGENFNSLAGTRGYYPPEVFLMI